MQILRTIIRFYLAPAHSLPTPWHQVVPFVLLVGTYLLFVRWLMPSFVSVVTLLVSSLVRLAVWLMVFVIVVPVFAYFGQKSQTNQGLRKTSQNILEWYGKVDTWTRS